MWLNVFLDNLVLVLWFFLPAGIANMVPVFAAKLPVLRNWNQPLDHGLTFRGTRILGDNKTVRGFAVGIIIAGLVCAFQAMLVNPVFGSTINPFWAGALLGFGALFGDAVKSFFKRRVSIAPGSSWFPFDQVDYILGAILVSLLFVQLSVFQYCLAVIVWLLVHMLTVFIGYLLKIREHAI